ncbi:MAG: hypothetical protein KKF89_00030 [Nanoarchaeota archaeon]|nr:hypothetical protein [Nanoarchaeota archaeon]MBU1854083.1 hypothetical protein [Nanoarchaeota archaeon]
MNKDFYFIDKLIDKTVRLGKAFNKWSEKNIFKNNLSKLSDKEIVSLFRKFTDKQAKMYTYGTILPLLDFIEFSFVESNLKKFLRKKVDEQDFNKYYEVFTQPIKNSFAQDQEECLLRLMAQFYSNKWINNIKNKKLSELKIIHPDFYKKLKSHAEKYAWVYYVYMGPAYDENNFLDFIKDYLNKKVNPSEELEKIVRKKENFKMLKQEYLEKLRPDDFNRVILNLAGKIVWAKPARKDFQSKSYYYLESLLREICKRLDITLMQCWSFTPELLEETFKKGCVDKELLNSIYKFHIIIPADDDTVLLLVGEEAKRFQKKNIHYKDDLNLDISEVKGSCAQPGKAKGFVKIINQPSDMNKMNEGDILVSIATTPSIVLAMKKAAAIVTDEGGITSHASIVSRELGITCVVGTKIATKVFKDGDLVEVDADNGVVKRINV